MTPAAVITTVLGYIVVLFAVAWASARRADNAAFFTGNRRTSWYMAAFAMIGAAMSGVTFVSVPGSVATDSFSYMQMVMGFTVGQLIVAFVLIPTFYRLRVVSLYEYLDSRFGVSAHRTGAWFFFISKMLGTSLRVYVVCAVLQLLVFDHYGLPLWTNALLTMILVWIYTQNGGVKTLIWTDTLKTFCLVASLILTIVFIVLELEMGVGEAVREVVGAQNSRVFFFDDPSSDRYFWKMFAAGVVLLIAMTGLDQDMMQRNLSCRSPRDSQKNIILTAVAQAIVIMLFLVLGALLYIYAARTGIDLPKRSDQLFSLVAVDSGLPAIVGVLFIIGLISSTYSAAGSSLTALTTSFTVDILEATTRYDNARVTLIRRTVHIVMAGVMAGVILCFGYLASDSVINLVFKVAGYTYGPILGMFVFGLCSSRKVRDSWIPLFAITAPILSAILQYLALKIWGYQVGFELLIYNAGFTIIGMIIISQRNDK